MEAFRTSDLGLATFLYWKGCEEAIPPFEKSIGAGGKPILTFMFKPDASALVAAYHADAEGIGRYNGIRRHLLRIVSTEIGGASHD